MSQNVSKAQHYVPQFYLRRFQNDEHVYVFDKTNSRIFKASTNRIAQEGFFYDLDFLTETDLPVDKQLPERALSEIESMAASVITKILSIAHSRGKISRTLQQQLAEYLAIQHLRTRVMRGNIDQMTSLLLDSIKGQFTDIEQDSTEYRYTRSTIKHLHMLTLFNPEVWGTIATTLINHIWILACPEPGHFFITSDHPIAVQPHIFDDFLSYAGLGSEGIEIVFPLSPTCLLIMKEKKFHSNEREFNRKSITLSADKVREYNRLQVKSSNRWLYSQQKDFADCDAYCNLYPELRIVDRQRLIVQ